MNNVIDRRNAMWERYQQRYQSYGEAQANFDLDRSAEYTEESGWRVDNYEAELPSEPPGEPMPNGPWALACEVVRNYEFPDPGILTGIYGPDDPLEKRVMLLRARFLIFTFWFAVRINQVIDEVRQTDLGPARVWGYSYYTLEGHFEMGEITFEVIKYLDSGQVQFHIHAYSQTGHISNIFYRIGFAIFGRWLQVRFAKKALERTQQLVTERLKR